MYTSWIKRIIFLFCTITPLYCNSIKISVPEYSKFDSTGTNYYDVEVSEDGVIQNIHCKKNDGTEKNWTIETQKDFSVAIESYEPEKVIKAFKSTYFILKNGMVYTAKQNVNNIQERYEFINKSDDTSEVLYSLNRGEPGKNVYDTFLESIKIYGRKVFSQEEKNQIHNLKMVLRTGLAEILIPYILCEDNHFDKTELKYESLTELREQNTVYSADNLKKIDGNPWATNQIHNAEIFIEVPVKSNVKLSFYNGFQNPNKTYLYEYNCRARNIVIVNTENNKEMKVELKDITDKQVIDITDIIQNEGEAAKIKIKIENIYEGTKYKDLCIQAILVE